MPDGPEFADEHHQRIAEFAADYLEEDERDEFIDGLMERRGYQRATRWLPPEPQAGDGGQGEERPRLVKPRQGGTPKGQGQGQQRGSYFRR